MVMKPNTDFSIRSILGGYDKNFTYIITCMRTGVQVCVDASVDHNSIGPYIRSEPVALLVTHSHGDHIAFLDKYLEQYPNMMILGHPDTATELVGKAFQTLTHNQIFRLGKLSFTALHTPGHYYDSITYQLESVLFTGDTLFVGRTGRVTSTRSNIEKLYDSIYNIILTLPKNIRIYPGHDYGDKPTISLKENIASSSLLQASDLKDFKARMSDYENNRQPGS
tara:strand:+ start:217 stop:885 length:669 start_codon:yes stop_codon:yes gene_type:complete